MYARIAVLALTAILMQDAWACRVRHDYLKALKASDPLEEADAAAILRVRNMQRLTPPASTDGKEPSHSVPWLTLAVQVESWKKDPGVRIDTVRDSYGTNCDPVFGTTHLVTAHPATLFGSRWLVYLYRREGHYYVSSAVPLEKQ